MIEFIIAAVFFVLLALCVMLRLIKGPTAADRAIACDTIDILATVALMLYAVYCGRIIFLDIAIVVSLLGTISTILIARYLEERL